MRVELSFQEEKAPEGLSFSFFQRIAERTCERALPPEFLETHKIDIDVAFVSDEEIAALNSEHRDKNKPTDILSFSQYETREEVLQEKTPAFLLGDLILSLDFIRRSAEEDGVSLEKELAFVFSHGILHLLGHDHSEEMFAIQDDVTDIVVGDKNDL